MDKLKFCCSCTKEINEEENGIEFYEMKGDSLKEIKKPSLYQKIKCFFGIHIKPGIIYDYIAFDSLKNYATLIDVCFCCKKITKIKHLYDNKHPCFKKIKDILNKNWIIF